MALTITSWSARSIKDDGFRSRFLVLPEIIREWVESRVSLRGADVLDFGCGEGVTALGIALQHNPRRIVGVDIMPDPERCLPAAQEQLGLKSLPENLSLVRVRPGELHDDKDRFDIAYSWSAFEHVDQRVLDDVIRLLWAALKPSGLLFVQVAPLYFSAEGSHLYDFVGEPWGHLLHQHNAYYDKLIGSNKVHNEEQAKTLWSTYRTLNKLTADQLIDRFCALGFKLLKQYRTRDTKEPPDELRRMYNYDVLTTNQVVLLLEKVSSMAGDSPRVMPVSRERQSERTSGVRICAFTSAAANYLPKVRLLCQSIKKYHPEFEVYWAIADDVPKWLNLDDEPIDGVISIGDLRIPEVRGWLFGHTIAELSTAIKPFVAQHFLKKQNVDAVLYFDPDMVLFSRLDDLVSEFDEASILLTPHQTKPESALEAIIDNEICSLRHGVFNLGFLGLRNDTDGLAFVNWWADRLYHFCHESLDMHLWTDQKWANLAPIFFDGVRILKSPRFNVAPWNITTRSLSGSLGEGIKVDGEPLGFYHFTGFDSGAHKVMATKYGGSNRAVMALVKWYEEQNRVGMDKLISGTPWAFGRFSNGEAIMPTHRQIYRMREDLQHAFPDPFMVMSKTMSYYEWFRARAHIEHSEIFALQPPKAAQQHLPMRAALSKGIHWPRVRLHLRVALGSPDRTWMYFKKLFGLWRREGIRGLKKRLSLHL